MRAIVLGGERKDAASLYRRRLIVTNLADFRVQLLNPSPGRPPQTSPPPPASTARPLPGRAAWLRRWLTGAPAHAGEPLVGHRIDWLRAVPFLALHAGCLGVLWVGISPVAVAVATLLYVVRMFAITGFYHRYFSHRAFRTSRPLQALCALVGG